MYEHTEKELDQILRLVEKCPEPLQLRCFEILLEGYVSSITGSGLTPPPAAASADRTDMLPPPSPPDGGHGVPAEIQNRFKTTARRLGTEVADMAALFDFESDPFIFHALHVPGASKAEKSRNVALLIAAKTYLANGQWVADWKEFRAQCVDHNCFDRTNMGSYLKHDYFKSASAEGGVALSASGIKAAETLLAGLAGKKESA
jgi:hypothetical protein